MITPVVIMLMLIKLALKYVRHSLYIWGVNHKNMITPEITTLQKHIGTYSKTKDIYADYRKSGWSKKFYTEHKNEIDSHKAVKKYFDKLGLEKLPTIKMLQTEYAALLAEKKSLYAKYKESRNFMQEILTVKQNAAQLLGYNETTKSKENERT